MQRLRAFRTSIDKDLQEYQLWRAYIGNFLRHNNNEVQHHADGMCNDTLNSGITNDEI